MPGKHEGWQGVVLESRRVAVHFLQHECKVCSVQLCVVSQRSAAFPAEPLGCPRSFALGTGRAAASVRGVAGSRCVPVHGDRGLSRAGLRRAKPLLPAAQPFKLATHHQSSAGSKMVLSEKAEGAAGVRCRSVLWLLLCAFPQSCGVNFNAEFSQLEESCCAVSTAVLWLWYGIKMWV